MFTHLTLTEAVAAEHTAELRRAAESYRRTRPGARRSRTSPTRRQRLGRPHWLPAPIKH